MSTPDLAGKVAVVTGATAGIGKEIARGLARLGAEVVLPCRSPERGRAARDELARTTGNERVSVAAFDAASQVSIRAFASELRAKHARLDILVNNAGCWSTERKTSPEGLELTWATNVLGYHLLTQLLLDPLRAAGRARIVNVASKLAGDLDLADLGLERRGYEGLLAYKQSKQANRMLTWALAERLAGTGVTANAAHPGFVDSELFREAKGLRGVAVRLAAFFVAKTPAQGADTMVWLASSPDVEGVTGKFWDERRESRCRFRDPAAVTALWEICERLTADRPA